MTYYDGRHGVLMVTVVVLAMVVPVFAYAGEGRGGGGCAGGGGDGGGGGGGAAAAATTAAAAAAV